MIRTQSANAFLQTHPFVELLKMKERAPDGYQQWVSRNWVSIHRILFQPLPCSAAIRSSMNGPKPRIRPK
jgi:hypothetical protein